MEAPALTDSLFFVLNIFTFLNEIYFNYKQSQVSTFQQKVHPSQVCMIRSRRIQWSAEFSHQIKIIATFIQKNLGGTLLFFKSFHQKVTVSYWVIFLAGLLFWENVFYWSKFKTSSRETSHNKLSIYFAINSSRYFLLHFFT